MSIIHKLLDAVIDQIKAGEVVDRPASVVKEIFENALDAGATEISMELMDGGKQLIRITDNGSGLDAADLRLAVDRHATSKLVTVDDLQGIGTFGFRGEALPSIAAVSRFTMRSRTSDDSIGQQLEVTFGIKSELTPVSMPVGTVVEVRDLFAVVPARLKFLRATATEFAHIVDYLMAMALAYPLLQLRLAHNGRDVHNWPATKDSAARFAQILGDDAKGFVSVNFSRGSFGVQGFVGLPESARPMPKLFLTFVNGRLVKDRVVRAGILQAYSGLVMKGVISPAVVFVSVDPSWVDVNAHPAKTEVRFYDPGAVQDLLTIGIQNAVKDSLAKSSREALGTQAAVPGTHAKSEGRAGASAFSTSRLPAPGSPLSGASAHAVGGEKSRRAEAVLNERFDGQGSQEYGNSSFLSAKQTQREEPVRVNGSHSKNLSFEPKRTVQGASASVTPFAGAPGEVGLSVESVAQGVRLESGRVGAAGDGTAHETSLFREQVTKGPFSRARYLGQFANCYLLLEAQGDMFVVDQHAFHERILFEELILSFEKQTIPQQQLLAPVLVPLPPGASGLVAVEAKRLSRLGFTVEILASNSVAVHAFPAFIQVGRVAEVFDEVLARIFAFAGHSAADVHPLMIKAQSVRDELSGLGIHPSSLEGTAVYHLFFATMACHSAVRAGDPLNEELVRRLLSRAGDVDFFAHCPHGRPVMRRFTDKDVASWFMRI